MRQTQMIRPYRPNIFTSLLAATLALAFFSACSGGNGESPAISSNGSANAASSTTATTNSTTTSAPASSTSASGTAAATNSYDAAMIKLTEADSYHFTMTTDVKEGDSDGGGKPSHSVADGVYAKANKAMQYRLDSNAAYSQPGDWIDIGNGKQAYHKVDNAWSDKGFITPPGVGFTLHSLLTVFTLRNATDSAGNAPPSSLGTENIDGQSCDHYRVKLPEQTYDVYISKSSGDVVRAELTSPTRKQTLSISHINEPVIIAPPI